MNRYQRRRYGTSRPRNNGPSRRWQLYIVALVILVAVVYFRLMHH